MIENKIIKKLNKDGKDISYWHNIDYKNGDKNYNFVCEIPRFSKRKIEMSKELTNNPLIHDIKDNKYRYYHQPIYWNYGFIPQTWENPCKKIKGYGGDGDPLDLVEIGTKKLKIGNIYKVKILGSLCLVDKNEIDWKIIGINKDDDLYNIYKNIQDVPHYILNGIREWFRWYKYKDNIINSFLYQEKFLGFKFTKKIIDEYHYEWLHNLKKVM